MIGFLESIATDTWRTSGSRYNAARRLKRRELVSTASLAFFSAFTIVLAFFQNAPHLSANPEFSNYLSVLAICLGLSILVLTLIEWGSACALRSDAIYRNAEELNSLQRKINQNIAELKLNPAFNSGLVSEIREEYEAIKNKCQYNHEPIDDKFFRATHRCAKEFSGSDGKPTIGCFSSALIHLSYWLSSVWFFAFLWVVIASVTVVTLGAK